MSISNNSNSSENSVDLIDLMIQIWKDKFYICFIVLSFLAFSIYQLNNATFTYDIFLKLLLLNKCLKSLTKILSFQA